VDAKKSLEGHTYKEKKKRDRGLEVRDPQTIKRRESGQNTGIGGKHSSRSTCEQRAEQNSFRQGKPECANGVSQNSGETRPKRKGRHNERWRM